MSINSDIYNKSIAHQQNVLNYISNVSNRISSNLNSNTTELLKDILLFLNDLSRIGKDALSYSSNIKRLNKLAKSVSKSRETSYDLIFEELKDTIEDLIESELETQSDIISYKNTNSKLRLASVMPAFLEMIIVDSTFKEQFKTLISNDTRRIMSSIKHSIGIKAQHEYIIDTVLGSKDQDYTDGAINTSKNQLSTFVATSLLAAQSAAVSAISDIQKPNLYGVFVAVLDSRTSSICRITNGTKGLYRDIPKPPLHYNCRSHIVPYYKTKPNGESNELGEPPRPETYSEWLSKQPKEIQNQALGETRAEIYRSGKLKIDQFYSYDKTLITLKDLRKRYSFISQYYKK